jgi:hypothetical protein
MAKEDSTFYKISTYIDNYVLAAATPETITKPAGYSVGLITVTAATWCKVGTAAVPAADVADGSGSFLLNVGDQHVVQFNNADGGAEITSLSMVSTAGGLVSIEWYR